MILMEKGLFVRNVEQHLLQWEVDDAALQMNDRLIGVVLFSVLLLFISLSGIATGFGQ